ncbi:helix-turn-helix domain-containing protein [Mycolicibacterium peregrinum]|uniref:helix-turn-helix domain-containing protein n=1 Tax=Mycolicibacterium peregrinum TaxID=43304 RepID=UPI000A9C430C|nr:helix-turn-helix transcriptional regulator [Mycolicibacterium peregrinum]
MRTAWWSGAVIDTSHRPKNAVLYRYIRHDVGIMSWERLAEELRERRHALDLSQAGVHARGGPSAELVRKLENNRHGRLSPRMRRALETALDWEPGSVDEILRGGVPTAVHRAPTNEPPALNADTGGPPAPSPDRFALARQVLSMRETLHAHTQHMEPATREALVGQLNRSAREAEEGIIALWAWLDDAERGEAVNLLAQLRAEE